MEKRVKMEKTKKRQNIKKIKESVFKILYLIMIYLLMHFAINYAIDEINKPYKNQLIEEGLTEEEADQKIKEIQALQRGKSRRKPTRIIPVIMPIK